MNPDCGQLPFPAIIRRIRIRNLKFNSQRKPVMDPLKKIVTLEPAKKAITLFDEFKTFAFKGNVIDLAIGVVIGAAFGKIVESLVKNIIMPLVSLVMPSEHSYEKWSFTVQGKDVPYGLFVADVVHFFIVAVALFFFIVKFL